MSGWLRLTIWLSHDVNGGMTFLGLRLRLKSMCHLTTQKVELVFGIKRT